MTTSTYRVIGPHGEGPFEVEAESTVEAAAKCDLGYGLDQPRGPHGQVIAYDVYGRVARRVGAYDITWLSFKEN